MMQELSNRELNRVRLRFLDLGKSFFTAEPDAEIMGRWRGIVTALGQESISPSMDQAVRLLTQMLAEMNLDQIREEFYTLFTDPFSDYQVDMAASCYIDGRRYGQTLVEFREFLKQADIGKFKDITESEDSLVIMLDVMVTLIEENEKQASENKALQKMLLHTFLFPMTTLLNNRLHENPVARFYAACSDFLTAYLDLEKALFAQ
jgi:TorA maturation chaperone TorD